MKTSRIKAEPLCERTPKKKSVFDSDSDSSCNDSPNLLEEPSPKTDEKQNEKINYDFTPDSNTDFGSPIFAQSQDILASLGRNYNPRNSDGLYSPMSN